VICLALLSWVFPMGAAQADGAQWFVAPGGAGKGSSVAPFATIQQAISMAQAGDTIEIGTGTYSESLSTVRPGSPSQPLVIRATSRRGSVVITSRGRVLTVKHPWITIEGLVLDGQYGADDIIHVTTGGSHLTLRNCEVLRTTYDAIDMRAPNDVLIENSLIHHALNAARGRTDAHGVAASAVHRLTIRNTEIHTFSGDGIQLDPDRAAPGWNDVVIENCKIWLAPLAVPTNGFAAGIVPGENAVDTKASARFPRARIIIRNTDAWGFRGGLIRNMAAFDLKENVDVLLDGVTVHESEIAFRLRGPGTGPAGAWVRIQNGVIYDVAYGLRYEDRMERLQIWNTTIGLHVGRPFVAAASSSGGLDVRNLLLLGVKLPREASQASNLAVTAAAFVTAAAHHYELAPGSPAIDAGATVREVARDRLGMLRPQGRAYDVGAYEYRPNPAPKKR
jgi:hypothetical protein